MTPSTAPPCARAAAAAFGVSISPTLLARADEAIV